MLKTVKMWRRILLFLCITADVIEWILLQWRLCQVQMWLLLFGDLGELQRPVFSLAPYSLIDNNGRKGTLIQRMGDGDRQRVLGCGSTEIPLSRHHEHPGWESFLNSLGCDSVLKRNLFVCRSSQDVSFSLYSLVDLKGALGGYSLPGGRIAFSTHSHPGSFEVLSQMLFWSKFLFLWQFIPLREEGFWSISCTSNLPLLKPSSQICFISVLLQPQTRLYLDYFRAVKFKWEEHTFNLTLPRSTLTS